MIDPGAEILKICKDSGRYMLRGIPHEERQDAVNGAVLRVVESMPQFKPGFPLSPWVRSIARNFFRDWLRKYHARRQTELHISHATLTESSTNPYSAIDFRADLVSIDRWVLEMIEDRGMDGASRAMGVSIRTLQRRLERMRDA